MSKEEFFYYQFPIPDPDRDLRLRGISKVYNPHSEICQFKIELGGKYELFRMKKTRTVEFGNKKASI